MCLIPAAKNVWALIERELTLNDCDTVLFSVIGFCGIFIQVVVLKIANDLMGERRVLIFSFAVGAMHAVLYAVATKKFLIYVAAALASLLMMSFPTISAIKSNNVNSTEQGRIQGALYSVQALASSVGPSIFRVVYHYTKDGQLLGAGSMFLVATVFYVAASICAYFLPPEANSRRAEDPAESSPPDPTDPEPEIGADTPLI